MIKYSHLITNDKLHFLKNFDYFLIFVFFKVQFAVCNYTILYII